MVGSVYNSSKTATKQLLPALPDKGWVRGLFKMRPECAMMGWRELPTLRWRGKGEAEGTAQSKGCAA